MEIFKIGFLREVWILYFLISYSIRFDLHKFSGKFTKGRGNDLINKLIYYKGKFLEIVILIISIISTFIFAFIQISNLINDLDILQKIFVCLLLIFTFFSLTYFISIIIYFSLDVLEISLDNLGITKELDKILRATLIYLEILPRELETLINIQRMIYFLYMLLIIEVMVIFGLHSYFYIFIKNSLDMVSLFELLVILLCILYFSFLPNLTAVYVLLERLYLPKLSIHIFNSRRKFEKIVSSFHLNTLNKPSHYYIDILIPKVLKENYEKSNVSFFNIITIFLSKLTQYFFVRNEKLLFFYYETLIVYTFMIVNFILFFIFMFNLKDRLESFIFTKEIIATLLLIITGFWTLLFLRLQIYLFPNHLYVLLIDKARKVNILGNVFILFFSSSEGKEQVNPYSLLNKKFYSEKRLDLTITIVSTIIITIILSVILTQIDEPTSKVIIK